MALQRLKEAAEKAKIELSSSAQQKLIYHMLLPLNRAKTFGDSLTSCKF